MKSVNHSYRIYSIHTKTLLGKILSFIPGTRAFAAREECADKIGIAYKHLSKVNASLKQPEHKVINSPSRQLKKSFSDTEVIIQRRQYKKIFDARPRPREAEDVLRKLDRFQGYGVENATRYKFSLS